MVQVAQDGFQPVAGAPTKQVSRISLGEVRDRVARFQQVLRDNGRLNVEQICHSLFRISA